VGVKLGLLTLQEGQRLRKFENGVLRGMFRSKRKEAIRGWRKI
jgi:hypothetical protein